MIKKKLVELPEVPNKQSQLNITDTTIYKLERSNSGISDNKYKLIIVGNSYAGKSSIISRYCNDIYQPFIPTIGIDYYNTCVEFKGKIIQLKIWDTAGTEKYRSLSTSYYRGSNGVFIVYDITDLNSLFKLNDWITDIQEFAGPDTIKILVGSKCDDTSNRKISVEEGQRIADEYRIPFIEVSSITNVNIDKLFYTMISKIHEIQEQKPTTILKATYSPSTKDVIHIMNNEFSNQGNKKVSSKGCNC